MKTFEGKFKAITFSFDDGVTQDIRLIEILNKYGLKATFNLNSSCLGMEGELDRNGHIVRHDKNPVNKIAEILIAQLSLPISRSNQFRGSIFI